MGKKHKKHKAEKAEWRSASATAYSGKNWGGGGGTIGADGGGAKGSEAPVSGGGEAGGGLREEGGGRGRVKAASEGPGAGRWWWCWGLRPSGLGGSCGCRRGMPVSALGRVVLGFHLPLTRISGAFSGKGEELAPPYCSSLLHTCGSVEKHDAKCAERLFLNRGLLALAAIFLSKGIAYIFNLQHVVVLLEGAAITAVCYRFRVRP